MELHQYSTDSVEPGRRFEYWNDVVCRHCLLADSRMLRQEAFDGHLSVRSVGAIDISEMSAPLHHWSREASHLRRGPDDDFWLACMEEGNAVIGQHGRHANFSKGDMVLYDSARPFDFTFATRSMYLLRLPRRSLLQRCPDVETLTALVIDGNQPAAAPLKGMIEHAVTANLDRMREGAAAQFGSTLLDLAAVALEFQVESHAPNRGARDLYGRIEAYIHRRFEDPELSLQSIAFAHGVSSRTITRAFAGRGQTPMNLVWQLRLEASRRALEEGRSRSVTEAAFDHGFSDIAHFSRAFRKHFGCAPHTLIRR